MLFTCAAVFTEYLGLKCEMNTAIPFHMRRVQYVTQVWWWRLHEQTSYLQYYLLTIATYFHCSKVKETRMMPK